MKSIVVSTRASGAKKALVVSALMAALIFASAPVYAANSHSHSKKWDPQVVQTVRNSCTVGGTTQSCQGGYTPTRTFGSALALDDVVTMTMIFVPDNSSSATLAFSDSLGNVMTVVSSQCAATSLMMCTAVGYFVAVITGSDDILFTVKAGHSGVVHYTAEDWNAPNALLLTPSGQSSSCASCTKTVSLPAINLCSMPREAVAVSTYQAYFNSALGSWTPSMSMSFFANDAASGPGYALLWQATVSTSASYTFSSTASVAPVAFAGSAEVLYL